MSKYYVWLDAGHSKATGGKRNEKANPKFYEYEFNNDIAVKLKARLEQHGINVFLTNTTPTGADIGLSTRANTANKKWNELGKPVNAIFVSIHGNASTGAWATARGCEVYHSNNASAKSKNLASLLTNQIYQDIYKIDNGFKQRGVKTANFTVIYKASMPSVLVECAFYDNQKDLALMQNHRNVFVEAHCKAICEYFSIKYIAPNQQINPTPTPTTGFKPYLAKCTATTLNCRKGAGTSYTVDRQITKGTVITIVEEKVINGVKWGKSKSGYWCHMGYMTFVRYA